MTCSQLDMESFLPSEIARLVYGYLEEEECSEAAQLFLETSVYLKECAAVANRGRKFNTKIYGLSLVDLFDFLSETISLIKENGKFLKESNNISSRLLSLLQNDNGNSDTPHKENRTERKNEAPTYRDTESIDLDQMKHLSNKSSRPDPSQKLIESENKESACFSYANKSSQICEKDEYSPHFINVKEENDIEVLDEDEVIPAIEPEVEILSPDIQQNQEYPQTVNLISNPSMIGKYPQLLSQPPQLLCQPAYGMVQMVPAYPTAHPTALFMPQQNMATSQQPFALHQSEAISFQTSEGTVSSANHNLPTMLSKPKVSTPLNQPASTLKTYMRTVDHSHSKEKIKQNIFQSKLRPIAPKIEDPISIPPTSTPKIKSTPKVTKKNWKTFEKGIKFQILHKQNNSITEAVPSVGRRCLRSRGRRPKPEQTATPFFIDIQEICNDN